MNASEKQMRDRRQHTRYLLAVPAVVRHGDQQAHTRLLEISRAGVALLSAYPIAAGTRIVLTFSPPGWTHDVRVEGDVVHNVALQRVGMYKVGVILVDVSQELSQQIIDFVYASLERI